MDKIVSTVNYEGAVYVFTEFGKVYEMHRNSVTREIEFRIICHLNIGLG